MGIKKSKYILPDHYCYYRDQDNIKCERPGFEIVDRQNIPYYLCEKHRCRYVFKSGKQCEFSISLDDSLYCFTHINN